MTAFKLTMPPVAEPVTLAEAKTQARIDATADDNFISTLITGARQWAEHYTGRAFITQTWQMWIDLGPAMRGEWWDGVRQGPIASLDRQNTILLPRAPLQSVNSVQYFDNTDAATVWPASNYFVDTAHEPGRVALRMGATWPIPSRPVNGIMVEYIAGYGDDGGSVPEPIKTAIRQLVTHWYEHRGEANTASTRSIISAFNSTNVPILIQGLLDPYRLRNSLQGGL